MPNVLRKLQKTVCNLFLNFVNTFFEKPLIFSKNCITPHTSYIIGKCARVIYSVFNTYRTTLTFFSEKISVFFSTNFSTETRSSQSNTAHNFPFSILHSQFSIYSAIRGIFFHSMEPAVFFAHYFGGRFLFFGRDYHIDIKTTPSPYPRAALRLHGAIHVTRLQRESPHH